MDFSKSVIMPREDFEELQIAAWSHTPTTIGERVGTTLQTTVFMTVVLGAFGAGAWVWYKLQSKLEKEKHEQKIEEIQVQAETLQRK